MRTFSLHDFFELQGVLFNHLVTDYVLFRVSTARLSNAEALTAVPPPTSHMTYTSPL